MPAAGPQYRAHPLPGVVPQREALSPGCLNPILPIQPDFISIEYRVLFTMCVVWGLGTSDLAHRDSRTTQVRQALRGEWSHLLGIWNGLGGGSS